MKAWHFLRNDGKLKDGTLPPDAGKTLICNNPLKMCESGLHASIRPIDALKYAPGNIVCRVEMGGQIIRGDDKLVASERTILWSYNADTIPRRFACQCALDVIHLWPAPDLVKQYLTRGDDSLRDAARDVAMAAARASAWDAAMASAWDAAMASAMAAATAAARASAWDAAMAAAMAAATAAARASAWDAAMAAKNRRLYKYLMKGRP
jgi:hypothetical protein